MEGFLAIIALVIISFIIFIIYFNFKVLQFVIQAINLYKKMVNRQDAMVKLLLDIRDNAKEYDTLTLVSEENENSSRIVNTFNKICETCKTPVPTNTKICPNCEAEFV